MKRVKIFAAATGLFFLLLSAGASAVEYGGVGGAPANPQPDNPRTKSIFVYTLKPEQQASDGIRVYNNTDKERTVSVYAVDSVLASGGAFSCAQQAEPRVDVGSWIQLETNQVVLAANTNKVIPFTITAPKTADAGEHDGCITIQDTSMTASTSAKSGVVLGFRSAIRVAVTVPGKIVKQLSLSSVGVSALKDGSYLVTSIARNGGNVSLDATVQVKLVNALGHSAAHNQGTYPVLAHSSARWDFSFKRPSWGGWYRAVTTVTYNSNPAIGLGKTGSGQKIMSRNSAWVYSTPTGAAVVIELLVLALVLAGAVWLFRSYRQKRHVAHNWQEYEVKNHETIQKLADKHSISWKSIAKANKLKAPYHLEKGQRLRLPPSPGE